MSEIKIHIFTWLALIAVAWRPAGGVMRADSAMHDTPSARDAARLAALTCLSYSAKPASAIAFALAPASTSSTIVPPFQVPAGSIRLAAVLHPR